MAKILATPCPMCGRPLLPVMRAVDIPFGTRFTTCIPCQAVVEPLDEFRIMGTLATLKAGSK